MKETTHILTKKKILSVLLILAITSGALVVSIPKSAADMTSSVYAIVKSILSVVKSIQGNVTDLSTSVSQLGERHSDIHPLLHLNATSDVIFILIPSATGLTYSGRICLNFDAFLINATADLYADVGLVELVIAHVKSNIPVNIDFTCHQLWLLVSNYDNVTRDIPIDAVIQYSVSSVEVPVIVPN